jgi:3-oxoacyl-[acyl-carrier protein] reductase
MALYPEFNGQRALVTGGGAGIGAAVVRLLAANGAAVAVLDANPTAAESLRAEVEQAGGHALGFAANAASATALPPVVAALEQTWGGIDLLVNAAGGIWRQRRLGEIDEAEWDAVLAANLKSAFLVCQAVLPGMQSRRHGRIVNVASDVARTPLGITGAHYVAAKSGVLGLPAISRGRWPRRESA